MLTFSTTFRLDQVCTNGTSTVYVVDALAVTCGGFAVWYAGLVSAGHAGPSSTTVMPSVPLVSAVGDATPGLIARARAPSRAAPTTRDFVWNRPASEMTMTMRATRN